MIDIVPKSRKRVSRKADKRKGRRPTARRAASDALAGAVARREAIFTETVHEAVSVIPEEYRVDRVTDPVEAVAPLDATRLAVEGLGRRYAQAMGCYSWLFWLRRLPSEVFSGGLATSGPYWRAVAEVMSSWTTTAEYFGDKSFRSVIPPISDSQLESLMKLCSLARLLGTVHGVIRRAGKGESVRWLRHGLPLPVSDPELDEMISLYDERHLSQAGFRAGTQPFKFQPFFAKLIEPGSWEQCALVVREAPEIAPVTYWRGPVYTEKSPQIRPGRFIAGLMTTANLRRLLASTRDVTAWQESRQLTSLLILLRVLFLMTVFEGFGPQWNALPSVGYLVVRSAELVEGIQGRLPAVSADLFQIMPGSVASDAEQVLADVAAIEAQPWPLARGPILRVAGAQTAVDVNAATYRIDELMAIPGSGGGALVNARGTHFEQFVQEMIDQTAWAPKPPLRQLWQRKLRLNGRTITDVDALAVSGSTVLLVSCKSVPYTHEYDCGDYITVRNVRSLIEEADIKWQRQVDKLRKEKRGDNYDFEGYELHGVVCTPFVVFAHRPQTRVIIQRTDRFLRATCSARELVDFLAG
jgi:hypothetical protein